MKNFLANVTDDRSYFNSFNLSNAGDFFQELNSKGLYLSSRKEKENRCLVFSSSINREIRKFQVVFVQRLQRNVQKSVMHVQSCCFVSLKLLLFCCSCCRFRGRCRTIFFLINKDHIPHLHYRELCYTRHSGDPWMLQKNTDKYIKDSQF